MINQLSKSIFRNIGGNLEPGCLSPQVWTLRREHGYQPAFTSPAGLVPGSISRHTAEPPSFLSQDTIHPILARQLASLPGRCLQTGRREAGRAAGGLPRQERAACKLADSSSTRCCSIRIGLQRFSLLSEHFLLRFGNFQA